MYGFLVTAGIFFALMTILAAYQQGSPVGNAMGVGLILAFAGVHLLFLKERP